MTSSEYENRLAQAGIRITAVRLLVLKTITEQIHNAFSLQDVMNLLSYSDTSTLFRTLTLFAEHHLLHLIDDGSGMQKYCICQCAEHDCHHVHLTCTRCHETICLKEVPLPEVPVPQGYLVEEAEFVVKGICPKCRNLTIKQE